MPATNDFANMKKSWKIQRYADDDAFARGEPTPVIGQDGEELPAVSVFEGNVLLNEGITALMNLLTGAAETAFSNANSYIAVGDSATAESAAHTGLQAVTNKLYKAVEATYPTIAGQTISWGAIFGTAEANYDWNEFSVASGNSDAADNLNRKVSAQGTKASGQIWTILLEITWS